MQLHYSYKYTISLISFLCAILLSCFQTVAQDTIYLKATGKIECQIKTFNYVEGSVLYVLKDQVHDVDIDDVSGVFLLKYKEYYRPDKKGEFQVFDNVMYAQPVQKNWIGISTTLRALPVFSGGISASYTRFFNQKSGVGITAIANPLIRSTPDFNIKAAQIYIFPQLTQHFYNYSTSSTLYYSIGYGASYQGGSLYRKEVDTDFLDGISFKEYSFNDWLWTLGQFSVTLGCEVYVGKDHSNALDFSIQLITVETFRADNPTSISNKMGYPQYIDGLYFAVGWRFGL